MVNSPPFNFFYAFNRQRIRSDAVDARAELVEEVTQLLHMRLGCGVVNMGRAFGECRRHDGVLGGGDTGFVHQNFPPCKRVALVASTN